MASITFNLKKRENGQMGIFAILRHNNEKTAKDTNHSIPPSKLKNDYRYWDKTTQTVKGRDDAHEINSKLLDWKKAMLEYKTTCVKNKIEPNIHSFKQFLTDGTNPLKNKSAPTYLTDLFQQFLDTGRGTLTPGTIHAYSSCRNHIIKYQAKHNVKLKPQDINSDFYKDFGIYMLSSGNDCNNNSINKQITKLRRVISWGTQPPRRYTFGDDYKAPSPYKSHQGKKKSLLPDELTILEGLTLSGQEEEELDKFLLACNTGLRYSDVLQLIPSYYREEVVDDQKYHYLDLTQVKGAKTNKVILNNKAIAIIQKYLDRTKPFNRTTPRLFIHYRQVKTTDMLQKIFFDAKLHRSVEIVQRKGNKVVREEKKLWEIIEFHFARKTYITRSLASNIPVVYVKENVGHSDIRTTMAYSDQDELARWKETLKALNK